MWPSLATLWLLYVTFFNIGILCFGGGYAAVAACGVSADQIACVRRIDAKSAWTVSSRVEAISVRKECF